MSLARDIVEAARRAGLDGFGPAALDQIRASPMLAPLIAAVSAATGNGDGAAALLLLAQALAVERANSTGANIATEFVATLPRGAIPGVRPTAVVVREMLERAAQEIVALGYLITREGGTVKFLQRAAVRGVSVRVVCDREGESTSGITEAWQRGVPIPELYVNTLDTDAVLLSKMHCKLLIVDAQEVLVTSANFTLHGLEGNIEFGVRISGSPAVVARHFFEQLRKQNLIELAGP